MPGPVTFNITYTCSPNAVSGLLEYRHVLPDGTWSTWSVNTSLGSFLINPLTGLTKIINAVVGNGAEFNFNTTYQFRIEQTCQDGTQVYSDPSAEDYAEACIDYVVTLGQEGYVDSSYYLDIIFSNPTGLGGIIDPLLSSITSYIFTVYEITGVNRNNIGSITVDYTDIIPNSLSHLVTVTSNDLTTPLVSSGVYEVDLQIRFLTSTQTILVDCPAEAPIVLPRCEVYKIWTAEWWRLEYTDCNGIVRKIYNSAPQPSGTVLGLTSYFFVCAQSVPTGATCLTSAVGPFPAGLNPPAYFNLVTNQITPITNPVTPGSWPQTNHLLGAVVEIDPNSVGCDSTYNGTAGLSNQNVTVFNPIC
jgi:hypothetical protein